MRLAPGYFTDPRELDAAHAEGARESLRTQQVLQESTLSLTRDFMRGWVRGDLGTSRQYAIPVLDLIKPRLNATAKLIACGIGCAWLTAMILAVLLSLRKNDKWNLVIKLATCAFLSVPIGVMATVCMLAQKGGALAVLTAVLAVRDFKLVYALLRQARQAPHLLYARAQGIPRLRVICLYLLCPLTRELLSIGMISLVTALSAAVPVEVIFDVPGLGQLAWAGAMNRDLPVLLGVTLLMALAVGLASTFAQPTRQAAAQ